VRRELEGEGDDDVRGGLDADDGGWAGPADDLRDLILLRCCGGGSAVPPPVTLGAAEIIR
jgi:hypothetical protein